jgi:integrase
VAPRDKHISRTPSGYRAHIRIHGTLHTQRFSRDTPLVDIRQWLLTTEMTYRGRSATRTGKFADDAAVYLESVKAMPTFDQRKQHIGEWVAVFGDARRSRITSDQIARQLHEWRTMPRTITKRGGKQVVLTLSPAAVNKRRTALMHLFTVLDGKATPNPVKNVPPFAVPDPAPRALPYEVTRQIILGMPPSKSQARLMVILTTGIPLAELQKITPDDVNLENRVVAIAGRRKGRGTGGRIVPLTDDGIAAFRLMAREEAWGRFTRTPLRRALRRAWKAAKMTTDVTTYDLRHSFGTEFYRRTGDIRSTQVLLGHSTPQLTHRYTLAATDPRVQASLATWAKVTGKVAETNKSRRKS